MYCSLTIPNTVSSIGDYAFAYCNGLTEVIVSWETPLDITANVFNQLTLGNIALKVATGTVESYQSASVWQDLNPIQLYNPTSITSNDLPKVVLYPNP